MTKAVLAVAVLASGFFAKERMFLTADGARLVAEGDEDGATLYAAPGDEVPPSAVVKFQLGGEVDPNLSDDEKAVLKQRLQAAHDAAEKTAAPPPEPAPEPEPEPAPEPEKDTDMTEQKQATPAATKEAAKPANKEAAKPANKGEKA